MNSPLPSPVVQAVVGLRDGYLMMQNNVHEYLNQKFSLLLFGGVREEKRILEEFKVQVEDEEEVGKSVEAEGSKEKEEENVELDEDCRNYEVAETVEEIEEAAAAAAAADRLTEGEERSEIFEGERIPIGNFADIHETGDETVSNKMYRFIQHMETESVLKVAIGLSVLILSSVMLGRTFRHGRENIQSPPPVAEPGFEPPVPDEEEKKPIESAANFLISELLINSMEEASTATIDWSHWSLSQESRAGPKIELLGELEVAEMSTFLRSCGMKNSRVIDSEVSSHSVSLMEKKPFLQISTFNQSEGGNQSEGKEASTMTTTTSLRRSSRIRNRVTL